MQLIKAEKDKCEINKCGNKADYTLNLNRSGIRSKIHICRDCLAELYVKLGDLIVPKSIETVRKTGGK